MAKTRVSTGQVKENLRVAGNQGITIPAGTTLQRNGSPQSGEIRFNTELNLFEGYANGVWASMGPFPSTFVDTFTGDGTTYEFVLSSSVPDADYMIVTVNGVTLTKNLDWRLIDGNILSFTEDDSTVNAPLSAAEITVRGFSPVTTASVSAGSIGLSELAFSDGTAGQVLTTNGSGTLSFQNIPAQDPALGGSFLSGTAGNATVITNSIGIEQLAVSDGTIGQVLATDGSGNLSFISVSGGSGGAAVTNFFDLDGQIAFSQIPDNLINIAKLNVTDGTAGQVLATDGSGNLSFASLAGETNTASNIGSGEGVFAQKSSQELQFKSVVGGTGISVSSSASEITFSSSFNTFANIAVAGQTTLAADSATDTLTIVAGSGISIVTAGASDTLTITNNSPNVNQNLFATITGDTGSTTANSVTDTLNIVGSSNINTSVSGDTLTITYTGASGGGDPNQNAFSNVAVSGESTVAADSETDTLTLVAGTGISLTTDAGADSITITATGGGGGSGTVNSGTANRLAYYATSSTAVSETSSDLTWNNSTGDLTVGGTVSANDIATTGAGVPTFTSGSDIILDAASGSGEVQITGDLSVSGSLSGVSIDDLTDVDTTSSPPSSGQVLKWDGSKWAPAADITSGGAGLDADTLDGFDGTYYLNFNNLSNTPTTLSGYGITDGIALTDISVGAAASASGSGGIAYNNTTGVFTFTPPDLSSYITAETNDLTSSVTWANVPDANITESSVTQHEAALSITESQISDLSHYTNSDVDTHLNTGSAGTSEILSWTGADYEWIAQSSGGASAASDLSDVDTSGATTGDMLYYNGSNWIPTSGPVIEFIIGANGSSDYTFSGPGFPSGTENDPNLVLYRGHTYRFRNTTGGSHPFLIKTSPGTGTGNQFTDGVSGSSTGTVIFEVPMTPSTTTLYYQCEFHAGMVGTITIV